MNIAYLSAALAHRTSQEEVGQSSSDSATLTALHTAPEPSVLEGDAGSGTLPLLQRRNRR